MIKFILILFVLTVNSQNISLKYFDYKKADNIAHNLSNENLNNLPVLSFKLTSKLETNHEKFRAIYKWVCNNIKNDYSTFEKNARKRKRFNNDTIKLKNWNKKITKIVFKKLIEDKKSVCTGYAYLIKELANFANIECEIVNGYGRNYDSHIKKLDKPNHSWNAVKLNNKWYLCDATWSSGYFDMTSYEFIEEYYDGYFLSDSEIFIRDHYPLKEKWKLETNFNLSDFVNSPLIYKYTHEKQVKLLLPKQMFLEVKKKQSIVFKFSSKQKINTEKIKLLVNYNKKTKLINPKNITVNNGIYSFLYKFDYNGFYDIHLSIENKTVASYTVRVKNK